MVTIYKNTIGESDGGRHHPSQDSKALSMFRAKLLMGELFGKPDELLLKRFNI